MNPKKIILKCGLSPGDIVMLTAAVRDLHKAHPGQFQTDVRTSVPEIWENNPNLTPLDENDPLVQSIDCIYPLINRCNTTPYHCLHGFVEFLSDTLGLQIKPSEFRGDIHLSSLEKSWASQVYELSGEETPFWILAAGGKYDVTIKWWQSSRYQRVIDHFRGRILFVQVGNQGHQHPRLRGVVDLRGRTTFRELIRLVHHSQGVLCPVTCLMHLAAAVETKDGGLRAGVVVAGGREPTHWEQYPGHQYLHTIGALSCCRNSGCWKDRTVPLGDGDPRDGVGHLCVDVVGELPHCMDMISPDQVIAAIERYYTGGRLQYLTGDQVRGARRAVARTRENGYDNLALTMANARFECERFIRNLPEPTQPFEGRGIVICAGGVRFFTCGWVCIQMLRRLGCRLPIEVWYLGDREMTPEMRALLGPLGVDFVDAESFRKHAPCRRLGGWELKAYAIVNSRFAEVLFLDADNVPVRNPEFLFDSQAYQQTGAIFWPDYGHFEKTKDAWNLLGMQQPAHAEFESGQMLVDKRRCWRPLRLALWFNEQSDFFYRLLHGDKETFHLAWRKLGQPFHFIEKPIETIGWTMCQHDPEGERLFQHRNTDKWSLHGTNPRVEGFRWEAECLDYLADLRSRWDGNAKRFRRKGRRGKVLPPSLWVGMASSDQRQEIREATLRQWQESDAARLEVHLVTQECSPETEGETPREACRELLQKFVDSGEDYVLVLDDDLDVNRYLWSNLSSWFPWIHREFELASLYHPGSMEQVCDVERRTDWINAGQLFTAQALVIARSRAERVLREWEQQEASFVKRLVKGEERVWIPFHNPSLVQYTSRAKPEGRGHEARNFLPDWKAAAVG